MTSHLIYQIWGQFVFYKKIILFILMLTIFWYFMSIHCFLSHIVSNTFICHEVKAFIK